MHAAAEVHQAADVATHYRLRACGFDAVDLAIHHRAGDVSHLHREESTKATTFVFALLLAHF